MSQADNLELRKVRLKHHRPRCGDIVQLPIDRLVAPETGQLPSDGIALFATRTAEGDCQNI
jgi:hypothetical protein